MQIVKRLRGIRGRATRNSTRRHLRATIIARLVLSFALLALPARSLAATETILYSFQGGTDASFPGGLVMDNNGIFYGVTQSGGSGCVGLGFDGCGTAFSLTPPAMPGGVWNEALIHVFPPFFHGGGDPQGVVFGPNGSLLGTTNFGGALD